jgi:hypothetical protein
MLATPLVALQIVLVENVSAKTDIVLRKESAWRRLPWTSSTTKALAYRVELVEIAMLRVPAPSARMGSASAWTGTAATAASASPFSSREHAEGTSPKQPPPTMS